MAATGAHKRKREQQDDDGIDDTGFEDSGDNETSSLLKLPGEIRNKIWAHTFDYFHYVRYGQCIDITFCSPFPEIPVAATVCRQMLAEVLGVFLNDVEFNIWISRCKGERDVPARMAYMRLCKLQREIGGVEGAPSKLTEAPNAPEIIPSGPPDFNDTVKWAKSVYKSDLDLEYDAVGWEGWLEVLFEMLQTAVTLREVPWEKVKEVLCSMRRIAALNCDEWADAGSGDTDSDYSPSELGFFSKDSDDGEW